MNSVSELVTFVVAAFVLAYAAVSNPLVFGVVLVVCAVAVVVVMSLVNIRWAWCVFFVGICANGVQTTVGGLTVRPEYFLAPLFVLSLYTYSRRDPSALSSTPVRAGIYIGAVGFVSVGIASSMLFAPDSGASVRMAIQLTAAFLAVVPLALVKLDMRFVLRSGTAILSVISVVSVVFFVVDGSRRVSGLAFEYNVMGALCVGWIGVLVYFASREGDALVDRPVMLAALPIVLALILTSTRAAWVALVIVLLFWAADNVTRKRITVTALVLGGILLVAGLQELSGRALEQDTFLWRVMHVVDIENGTGAYRLGLWTHAVDQMAARDWTAVLGTGFNSFSQFNPIDPTSVEAAYLSSMWLALLYDTGFVGTAFFLVLVASLFASVDKKWSAAPLFVALAVCTGVTSVIWFAFPWVFLALVVNHSLAAGSVPKARAPRARRRHRVAR